MTVEELIKKLKKCPKKAQVCLDSNNLQYWFGEDVEVIPWSKSQFAEEVSDETDSFDDLPNFRSIVKLS